MHWGDIRDVITDAFFGDDWLRGFCVASSQIVDFSIGFRCHHYNTLALQWPTTSELRAFKRALQLNTPGKVGCTTLAYYWYMTLCGAGYPSSQLIDSVKEHNTGHSTECTHSRRQSSAFNVLCTV